MRLAKATQQQIDCLASGFEPSRSLQSLVDGGHGLRPGEGHMCIHR